MILRIVDLETTGMTPPAEVCEAGFADVSKGADGSWRYVGGGAWLCHVPEMPPETRAVHHITLDDVRFAPVFKSDDLVGNSDKILVAHQAAFEQAFIEAPGFDWICSYKCALRVWPNAPGHSNSVLRYWLEDQGLLKLDHDKAMPPHRAGPDAYVTAHILLALLKHATVEQMILWTGEPRLLPTCPIGKWRGFKWAEVDGGFLYWMLGKPDMDADLKWNARRELNRRIAEK